MIKNIYSVYDSKAEAFLQPIFCVNTPVAVRMFSAAVNDPDHEFCRFAVDYALFLIGKFDEDKGTLVPCDAPEHVVSAMQCIKKEV